MTEVYYDVVFKESPRPGFDRAQYLYKTVPSDSCSIFIFTRRHDDIIIALAHIILYNIARATLLVFPADRYVIITKASIGRVIFNNVIIHVYIQRPIYNNDTCLYTPVVNNNVMGASLVQGMPLLSKYSIGMFIILPLIECLNTICVCI